MRTNIVLDEELIQEAFKYTQAKTKRELVELALREFVENHRRRDLMDLFGKGGIRTDYDYKKLRAGED
jgi:Arc/MetJ family transcription regulator